MKIGQEIATGVEPAETNVNPALIGRLFVHHAPERVQGPDYDWIPGGADWVGEYVRSIRNSLGEHWIELRLVQQGAGTAAALGSVYSLRADRVKAFQDQRQPAQLEGA
jgi:hypothetical protein